ncbi:putative integral membrane protein [Actinacidiphila reveromycinica]|uniref:Putative integral membrane protein n=2 Tax=Actinacidiphila reveromycinica TaxID=659352 RepID=A0A7U3UU92_9ACTN|nr:putative integral membrane protein [Streptomyces sp. SN-593]
MLDAMTTTDWIIDIVLVLIVFRQMREERLTARTVLLPLAIIGWAAVNYLHPVPTAGNDLLLAGLFAAAGVVFGLFGGLLTRVRLADGQVRVRASVGAAALWVASMGFRLGFAVWSSHASGAAHVAHFSSAHDITSAQAWVVALILMAFGEVVVRLGTIVLRGQRLLARARREETAPAPQAQPGAYV